MVRLRRHRELLDLARTANDFTRTTTHFVRAASHRVRHIIAGRLSSPGHVVRDVGDAVHDVGDASRDALKTLGRRVPKAGRRIGHALTKFQSQPRRKIRKAPPSAFCCCPVCRQDSPRLPWRQSCCRLGRHHERSLLRSDRKGSARRSMEAFPSGVAVCPAEGAN